MSERNPPSQALFAELPALIDAAHRGDIRGDQMKRLEQLLRDPRPASFIWSWCGSRTYWPPGPRSPSKSGWRQCGSRGAQTVLGFLHSSLRRAGWALARHPVAAASLVLVAAVPLIAWLASTPSPPQVATDEGGNRPPCAIESQPDTASTESDEEANEDTDQGSSPLQPPRRRVANPVARLARTVNCAWASDRDAPEAGDDLAAGQTLVLKSGLAEIVFQSGARTILQGPARLWSAPARAPP